MSTTISADEQSSFIKKLKHACSSYDSAARKYLGAVKELDVALEALAIAFRELAQGEENEGVRNKADTLCTAVDRHMANTSVNASASNKAQLPPDTTPPASAGYPFASYMSDFTHEMSYAVEELRETLRAVEKAKTKQDELVSKYSKKRSEVDSLEMKLAKKNQGITSNEKFAAKVADRDALKALVAAGDEEFTHVYNVLLQKRSQTIERVIDGMHSYSGKYYMSLAKTLRS
ncbi:hypothetical protein LSCM1_06110 [Leishmania martiniquensis]|uniref:BAR domain-containing protein n=1 Tax=Leishmania martiniquensis TaxID=1580590 RepID=A0A836HIT8_9TRYP|nr:hypothetical protein LSCM1_06110 [Leishmania martiniquensis]